MSNSNTGDTTPENERDPGQWSIASERGSPSPGAGDERPVTQGSGWDNSVGRRSGMTAGTAGTGKTGESFPGLGTLLTPPPVRRGMGGNESSGDVLPLGGSSEDEKEVDIGVRRVVTRETMGGLGGTRGGEGSGSAAMGGSLGVGRAW